MPRNLRKTRLAIVLLGGAAALSGVAAAFATFGFEASSPASTLDVRGSIESVPAEQQWALADGTVTFDEHEQAIANMLACGAAAGYVPAPIVGSGLRPTRVGFSRGGATGEAADHEASKRTLDSCSATYLDDIDKAWASQRPAPTTAQLEANNRWLEGCVAEVRDAGPAVSFFGHYPNSPAEGVAISPEQYDVYAACALEAEALTGFPAPPPVVLR